jgi:hypothetical protein
MNEAYDQLNTALKSADWYQVSSASSVDLQRGVPINYETWRQRRGLKRLVIEYDRRGGVEVYFVEPSNRLKPALDYISHRA